MEKNCFHFRFAGQLLPAIGLFAVCFLGCNKTAVVAALVIGTGFSGLAQAGYGVNQLDIAPIFSGLFFLLHSHHDSKGPSATDRTQVGPCWPHEPCYLGAVSRAQNRTSEGLELISKTIGYKLSNGYCRVFLCILCIFAPKLWRLGNETGFLKWSPEVVHVPIKIVYDTSGCSEC